MAAGEAHKAIQAGLLYTKKSYPLIGVTILVMIIYYLWRLSCKKKGQRLHAHDAHEQPFTVLKGTPNDEAC